MIALIDLSGAGLVACALGREGPPLRRIEDLDTAAQLIHSRQIDGCVIEAAGHEVGIHPFLQVAKQYAIPVLVVARQHGIDAPVRALRSGATDYLHAPFEYEALIDALERLLDACVAGHAVSSTRARFVTQDPELRATLELAKNVAASDATVLVEGESGTGKELVARIIHESSPRRRHDMVSVNCAALPAGLLESELFGHERGAFTGAFAKVIGKFELADGTTLLLDEIGELELALQAKLLRVIQEKQVQRVGAPRPIHVDFRLVATTNRDMSEAVRHGEFREDLYYRLNVLPIKLKPLRDRGSDIPLLVAHFLRHIAEPDAQPIFLPETLEVLTQYPWPGNVRELQNVVERLALTHPGREVHPNQLSLEPIDFPIHTSRSGSASGRTGQPEVAGDAQASSPPPFETLRQMERWLIVKTLTRLEGNRTRAARQLGISLRTLRNKINEYEIDEPETRARSGTARTTPDPQL